MSVIDLRLEELSRDPVMARLIERVGPYQLRRTPDAWEALASAVVYQQVSGKAAAKVVDVMSSKYEPPRFPSPRDILQQPMGVWQECGMTARKATTLITLARDIVERRLDLEVLATKHDNLTFQLLTRYPGVGAWTVEMWLVFHAGREDIFMPGDLGLRKAIQREYALPEPPTPVAAADFALRWRPYRTLASWYLWRSDPKFPEPGFPPAPEAPA